MASLCLSEAVAEAKENGEELFVTTLDASKAFDVVAHNILKRKLCHTGMESNLWQLLDSLYTDCSETVRWQGEYGEAYQVSQGVRQGGTMSPHLYKTYVNSLLKRLETAGLGLIIGDLYMGTPTCADDVLLLSDSKAEMQAMINICHDYSLEHKYELHPGKSQTAHFVKSNKRTGFPEDNRWSLGNKQITKTEEFTHLGLDWTAGRSTPNIKARIGATNRTRYALMGVGLHGINGLDPGTACKLVNMYVLPKLIYGLESVVLTSSDYKELDLFYKQLLKQLQGLPDTTANEAVYLLLGAIPVKAWIHIRTLGMFGAVMRLGKSHSLYKLAVRQLESKSDRSKSWFRYVDNIANSYNIDLSSCLDYPWPKETWKGYTKAVVKDHWWGQLTRDAKNKSSLKWLCVENCELTQTHEIWKCCRGKTYMVESAVTRAKMLCGRYLLQATRARFNQNPVNPACPLCGAASEDLVHFLIKCPLLEEARNSKLADLEALYTVEDRERPSSDREWCMAILNGGTYRKEDHTLVEVNSTTFSQVCNLICKSLHIEHDVKVNAILMGE